MASEQTVTTSWFPSAGAGADRILVVSSPDRGSVGRAAMLSRAVLHVGRAQADGPSMVLDDDRASRQHAAVEYDGSLNVYRVRDLGSHNGTFVDGDRVQVANLSDGTVIRIGAHVLLFQSLDHDAAMRLFDRPPPQSALIGASHRLQRVHNVISTVAKQSYPVLILGESGVGKELVASAIHLQSERTGPFVPINCAALPENLIESELFGHARAAFTGASARRGLFKEAEKGTLFLDEIGEMRLELQAKLLRVLVTGEVRPVGEDRSQSVDVRIVAATNADLENAVEKGTFRGDLYARLMGYVIHVPTLRQRPDDILILARHFLAGLGHSGEITPDAAEALLVHPWPYNVRELEQVMRVAGPSASHAPAVDVEHLPERLTKAFGSRRGTGSAQALREPEASPLLSIRRDVPPNAQELREVLTQCDGNIARVAAFFRKDRRQIYRWAERLGLEPSQFRDDGNAEGGD